MSQNFIKKTKKQIEKKLSKLQKLNIDYVPVTSIKPNSYNPNRQSDFEFELLCRSILEDGFTQPIVCQGKTREFVDGEHRWTAFIVVNYLEENGLIQYDEKGNISFNSEDIIHAREKRFEIMKETWLIPVVFVDMSIEQMRISTLRHNKARGSHDIELEAQVLRDLEELGALNWAQDSLMMSDEEVNRLLEDIPVPEALAGEEFSQSWEPDDIDENDEDGIRNNGTQAREISGDSHGGSLITAVSHKAISTIQERQVLIAKAKTEEEKQMAKQQTKLYRLSLIFAHEEADIVEKIMGKEPAVKLLDMCKKELGE